MNAKFVVGLALRQLLQRVFLVRQHRMDLQIARLEETLPPDLSVSSNTHRGTSWRST